METGFVVFVVLGCLVCAGLGGITMELHRIAAALEEKNRLHGQRTQP